MQQPTAVQVPGWTVKIGEVVMVAYKVHQLYDNGIGFLMRPDGTQISVRANEILTHNIINHVVPMVPIQAALPAGQAGQQPPTAPPQPVYVNPENRNASV